MRSSVTIEEEEGLRGDRKAGGTPGESKLFYWIVAPTASINSAGITKM